MPLHAQVERLLRDLIREPAYREGRLLPDEVTLARRLGVSRNTVRAGIARLAFDDGISLLTICYALLFLKSCQV